MISIIDLTTYNLHLHLAVKHHGIENVLSGWRGRQPSKTYLLQCSTTNQIVKEQEKQNESALPEAITVNDSLECFRKGKSRQR